MMHGIPPVEMVSTASLIENMREARRRTLDLLEGLDEQQLMGPKLPTKGASSSHNNRTTKRPRANCRKP